MKERIVWLTIMVMCLTAAAAQAQGYGVPAGGWFYIQEFDSDILAQSWYEDNSDWDGTAPGTGTPGGVAYLTEGDTTYIRIQDAGRPGENGYSGDDNDKMCFWLDLEDVGLTALQGDTLLDDGVTLAFRARIATTGTLDDRHYHDANPPAGHTAIEPWLTPPMENGEGHQIHNHGNGMFSIHQVLPPYDGDDDGSHIAFSLVTDPDTDRGYWTHDGLTMNSLRGTAPRNNVDSDDGTRNVTSAAIDGSEWHEWWITIEADGVVGSHIVTVYMDGSLTGEAFNVTGGLTDTSGEKPAFIRIGSSNSDEAAAWDTDYMAVGLGVIPPVPGDPDYNPPPSADAGPDQTGYYPEGNPFQLTGSASDEAPINPAAPGNPAGIASFYWTQRSGAGTATITPGVGYDATVSFSAPGVYEMMLQVTDNGAKDGNDIVVITLKDHAADVLVGHWAFENNLLDSTVSANHGTGYGLSGDMAAHELAGDAAVLSAVSYSSDGAIPGSAASLSLDNPDNDDPNHYVCVGDAPELDDLSVPADFTVTAWVKTFDDQGSDGPRTIISKGGDGPGGVRWMLKANNGNARIITDDNSNKRTATGGAVDDGLWHFVVGTVTEDAIAIYVDGIQRDDDTGMGPDYDLSGTSQRQAFIGAATRYRWPDRSTDPNNYPSGDEGTWTPATEPNQFNVTVSNNTFVYDAKVWDGLLDEIKVYNYALPLTDPTYTNILDLAAEGELPADVDAGPNKTVELQRPIVLTTEGTSTDNGIPGTLIYQWSTVGRPEEFPDANAVFTDDTALVTGVEFPEFGEWELQVTVFDVNLGVITDTSTVTMTLVSPDCSDIIAADLLLPCDISGPEGGPDCHCDLYDVAAFAADFMRCNDPQADCEDAWGG